MGFFRLLLALSVVFSHVFLDRGGPLLIGGWRAVQVFYFISGFYMALILDGRYQAVRYSTFLGNRLLRLLPLYYISLLLIGARMLTSYLRDVPCQLYFPHCGEIHWRGLFTPVFLAFTQLTLIGQDWLFFLKLTSEGSLHFTSAGLFGGLQGYKFNLNPVSWTLGLELTFYLMAPFLLRKKTQTLFAIITGSLFLRAILYFGVGLNFIPWTYRFFPFELGIFLAGSVAYRIYAISKFEKSRRLPLIGAILGIAATCLFPYLAAVTEGSTLIYYALMTVCIPCLFSFIAQEFNRSKYWGSFLSGLSSSYAGL